MDRRISQISPRQTFVDLQFKPQNLLKLIHGKVNLIKEKNKIDLFIDFWKHKKKYFVLFTNVLSLVFLIASYLYFHFLANEGYDGDLYVMQILLKIPLNVQS